MSNEVLNKSIQSAWLNILMSIWIRLFTFIFDAVFLRYVTQEYLGIGVRTALLTGTLLFISREPFRRACLTKPENEDWKGQCLLLKSFRKRSLLYKAFFCARYHQLGMVKHSYQFCSVFGSRLYLDLCS